MSHEARTSPIAAIVSGLPALAPALSSRTSAATVASSATIRLPTRGRFARSRSGPTERRQRRPCPVVAADQVRESRAVRVAAGQRHEVGRAEPAAALLCEPTKQSGRREPVHRIVGGVATRREDRLEGHPADVVGRQREVDDRPDLAVVHAQPDRAGERGEDPGLREAPQGLVLRRPQIRTAVRAHGRRGHAVVLEVDLDPVAKRRQQTDQPIVPGEAQTVRVEDGARHAAGRELPEDCRQVGVKSRLATRQHEAVEVTALASDDGIDGPQDVGRAGVAVDLRAALGEAGRAPQVACIGQVDERDAGVLVLELVEAVVVSGREGSGVARLIRREVAGRHAPPLEPLPSRVILLVEARHLAVSPQAVPAQEDTPLLLHELALENVGRVVDDEARIVGEASAARRLDRP